MNRTIEDSKQFDVVCMSFGKEKQRGIKVVQAGERDSFIIEPMGIKAEKNEIFENGDIKLEDGSKLINIVNFQEIKKNNENRPTEHSLKVAEEKGIVKNFMKEKLKREGKIVDLNEQKKRRKQKDSEQVI